MKKFFALVVLGAAFTVTNPILAQNSNSASGNYSETFTDGEISEILQMACEIFNVDHGRGYCLGQLSNALYSGELTIDLLEDGERVRISYGGDIIIGTLDDAL